VSFFPFPLSLPCALLIDSFELYPAVTMMTMMSKKEWNDNLLLQWQQLSSVHRLIQSAVQVMWYSWYVILAMMVSLVVAVAVH
jgi:hypothetical protein